MLVLALAFTGLGLWITSQDVTVFDSRIATNWVNWGAYIIAAALFVFGVVGVVSGARAASRSAGDDSIDVIADDDGLIVRGGRRVPWSQIRRVQVIRYINEAKVPLLWDYSVLNRVVRVHLRDATEPRLEIDLRRYPREDYQQPLDHLIALFEQQRLSVSHKFKHKQF